MATVLQISDYRRKERQGEAPQGSATIHLFLGVRYERHIETDLPTRPARGGARESRKRA